MAWLTALAWSNEQFADILGSRTMSLELSSRAIRLIMAFPEDNCFLGTANERLDYELRMLYLYKLANDVSTH